MKKLAYSLAFGCILVAPGVNAGWLKMPSPGHSLHRSSTETGDKAVVTRTEDAETFVFRFSASDLPDDATFGAAIARYKKVQGFRSLRLGSDNVVVLTTDKAISAEALQKLLLSSTRMYGHLGFEINS